MTAAGFSGKSDETLMIQAPAWFDRVLLIGMGKLDLVKPMVAEAAGGGIYAQLVSAKATSATVIPDTPKDVPAGFNFAADIAMGALLRSYRFDKYRTVQKPGQKPVLTELTIAAVHPNAARSGFNRAKAVARLFSLRATWCRSPQTSFIRKALRACARAPDRSRRHSRGSGEAKLAKLGMGALLGSGRGASEKLSLSS